MRSINPACKFIGILIFTLILSTQKNPALHLGVFALCMLLLLLSRVSRRHLFAALIPVAVAAAAMFFTGFYFSAGSGGPVNAENLSLTGSRLQNGLTLSSRVLAFAGLGYLFAFTTDKILLIRSMEQQLHLPPMFAYGLFAAWGIMPNMIQEYRRTKAAFTARGIRTLPFSPAVLKPMLVKSVRWSEALSIAMESKGFTRNEKRSCFEAVPVRWTDIAFPIITCTVLIAVILLI